MHCTQRVSSFSRDGHRLVVDGDALNLTELGQGFVCGRDGNGLRGNGHTLDALQCTQRVAGVGCDGETLAVNGYTFDVTKGLLRLFAQLAVDGEHRLLVLGQYALGYVLDVLIFLLLLLELCHLLTYLALTAGISGQSLFQQFVDFLLYLLFGVEILVCFTTLSTFAATRTCSHVAGVSECIACSSTLCRK